MANIGETTALIPQAGASTAPEDLIDGQSGDTDFPYGRFKALATVGETDPTTGKALTGYPDGQVAYLLDNDTVRVVYQSESYGTISNETYGWEMDSGAVFTGSHVHTIDYNRKGFADFLKNEKPASSIFEGSGKLFSTVYNVFGKIVTGKNANPSDLGAKWGNQALPNGTLVEFDTNERLTEGDFYFHSFCGSYYEPANKHGSNIGFADDIYLMGEEWNIGRLYDEAGAAAGYTKANSRLSPGEDFFLDTMGLASMVVDVANETAYTVPALGQGGYEKLLPINSGSKDYVVIVATGYNQEIEPQPLTIYIGKKGVDAQGKPLTATANERDAFLGRNGLLYGQLYGMALADATYAALGIQTVDADTKMMDNYAVDADAPTNFAARYYPTSYRWDGFDTPESARNTEILKWEQDGDNGEANEQPSGFTFFNGDSKTEHPAVDPDPTKSRYVQNLTVPSAQLAIDFENIANELVNNDADGNGLPDYLTAAVTRTLAGVDGALTLETGGKGAAPISKQNPEGKLTHAIHVEAGKARADQPDGLQWIKAADGDFLIVDEDSGNDAGERKYVLPIDSETLRLTEEGKGYFLASAGGADNPRAKAGVAALPGSFSRATSAEFSGSWNVTGLVAKKADGSFYTPAELAGMGEQAIISQVPIADQTFIGVVQHSGESGGDVAAKKADQGGQVFQFNIGKYLLPAGLTVSQGTNNVETIALTTSNNLVVALGGNDSVSSKGSNRIFTNTGNDDIITGSNDDVYAGAGNDTINAKASTGGGRIEGEKGNDVIQLGAGDRVLGNDGDDQFYVNAGGDNIISGGNGADQFWIANKVIPTTGNTIVDYTAGTDVLGIAGLGVTNVSQLTLAGETISFNGRTLATLEDVDVTKLTNSNFAFA